MKHRLFALIVIAMCAVVESRGQVRDVSLSAGALIPMHDGVESGVTIGVNYGQFFRNGLGFRAGVQLTPSVANVDHSVGVPLHFAWRMGLRSTSERLSSGIAGAYMALSSDNGYRSDDHSVAGSVPGAFLMNLFSGMELFAGVTPGYVSGTSSSVSKASWGDSWQYWEETWTEKASGFSFMLDAGMCLNYSIWRFDVKVKPAFHCLLTDNYLYHSAKGEIYTDMVTESVKPLRWFFSLEGGLAYRF